MTCSSGNLEAFWGQPLSCTRVSASLSRAPFSVHVPGADTFARHRAGGHLGDLAGRGGLCGSGGFGVKEADSIC